MPPIIDQMLKQAFTLLELVFVPASFYMWKQNLNWDPRATHHHKFRTFRRKKARAFNKFRQYSNIILILIGCLKFRETNQVICLFWFVIDVWHKIILDMELQNLWIGKTHSQHHSILLMHSMWSLFVMKQTHQLLHTSTNLIIKKINLKKGGTNQTHRHVYRTQHSPLPGNSKSHCDMVYLPPATCCILPYLEDMFQTLKNPVVFLQFVWLYKWRRGRSF